MATQEAKLAAIEKTIKEIQAKTAEITGGVSALTEAKKAGMTITPTTTVTEAQRYTAPKTETTDKYAEETKRYIEGLDITPLTEEEKTAIKERTRTGMQAYIDSINEMYIELVKGAERTGVEALGMTRAIGARSGLLGSPMGEAQLAKTKEMTAEQIKALRSEQNVKVQAILARAEERADEEIRLKGVETKENIEKRLNYLLSVRTESREDWLTLAKAGTNLDVIKANKELYFQYLEETNWTPLELDSLYEANLPKLQQSDYSEIQYRGENGNLWLKRVGFSPITQQKIEYDYDLGLPYPATPEEIKVFDGLPYRAVKDSAGNVLRYEAIGGVTKEPKVSVGEKLAPIMANAEGELKNVIGSGGFVDINTYRDIRTKYGKEGIQAATFDNQFSDYLSPSDRAKYGIGTAQKWQVMEGGTSNEDLVEG